MSQKEAAQKGVRLNKAIISLIERAMGPKAPGKKKRVLYNDLDHFARLWSREEATEFDSAMKGRSRTGRL